MMDHGICIDSQQCEQRCENFESVHGQRSEHSYDNFESLSLD